MVNDDTTHGSACQATRVDGSPCGARPMGNGYCWAHDPGLAEKRSAAHAEGGKNKATAARLGKLMPPTLRPVLDLLYTALEEVHTGDLDPRQASAMAALSSAIGRLYEAADLQARLEALESVFEPERARSLRRR